MTRLQPPPADLRRRVEEIARHRATFTAAKAVADPAGRAGAVAAILAELPDDGVRAALDTLARAGEPALPTILGLLDAPRHAALRARFCEVLAKAGGRKAVPRLVDVIEKETAFFEKQSAVLKRGWWNAVGLSWKETERYRRRYSLLYSAVLAVEPLADPRVRPAVTALRDLWRAHPQYEDSNGLDQVSEACDRVLKRL